MLQNRTILIGDVLEKIKEIPDKSVDCVVTSPPYWGLRDYGTPGQWGLEPNFFDYLAKLDKLMDEIWRLLKDTGTVWINLGDTYAGGYAHSDWSGIDQAFACKRMLDGKFKGIRKLGVRTKSRAGIPWRFYINCIDKGWIARNEIPWIKGNAMPSSVKDRFQNKWEPVFFFAKNPKYYFNLDAVREPCKTPTKPFNVRVRDVPKGKYGKLYKATDQEIENHNNKGEKIIREKYSEFPNSNVARLHRNRAGNPNNKQDNTLGADGKPKAHYKGFNARWKAQKHALVENGKTPQSLARKNHSGYYDQEGNLLVNPKGKNPGDVFCINVKPFKEAHFATFPPSLPEKILKCACPPNGWVLDPFFGAGTVGLVAEQMKLNWIGIELKQEYVEIARKRIAPLLPEAVAV